MSTNLTWNQARITKSNRRALNGHGSFVVWLTGLSGAGKSTIANELEHYFYQQGQRAYVLDGDNMRFGLNSDLSFSEEDRRENIRRVAEVAKLMVDAGVIVIAAFISPYRTDRQLARMRFEEGEFVEVHVKCALDTCIRRDPKGLYEKALAGTISNFTGIQAPYEEPTDPELKVDTDQVALPDSVQHIVDYLSNRGMLKCTS